MHDWPCWLIKWVITEKTLNLPWLWRFQSIWKCFQKATFSSTFLNVFPLERVFEKLCFWCWQRQLWCGWGPKQKGKDAVSNLSPLVCTRPEQDPEGGEGQTITFLPPSSPTAATSISNNYCQKAPTISCIFSLSPPLSFSVTHTSNTHPDQLQNQ